MCNQRQQERVERPPVHTPRASVASVVNMEPHAMRPWPPLAALGARIPASSPNTSPAFFSPRPSKIRKSYRPTGQGPREGERARARRPEPGVKLYADSGAVAGRESDLQHSLSEACYTVVRGAHRRAPSGYLYPPAFSLAPANKRDAAQVWPPCDRTGCSITPRLRECLCV